MIIDEIQYICAACEQPMTLVTLDEMPEHAACVRRRCKCVHVTCRYPRCPLNLSPAKTVLCTRVTVSGPEA